MLKIRRPLGRLIFNMGIAIPGKTVFLIETAPRSYCTEDFPLTVYCDLVLCYQIIKSMKLSHPNIGSALMCTICSDIVCNREKNHFVEIGLWVKACYCATNRLMHFLSLYIWGLWMLRRGMDIMIIGMKFLKYISILPYYPKVIVDFCV